MNHIYRVVWNACMGMWQVVSEVASGRAKSSTTRSRRRGQAAAALALAAAGGTVFSADVLPTGGRVVAGQATIQTAGQTMTVNQTSNKAALDWTGFSIGQGSTVNFVQPSSASVALNRVLGADPSLIQGALKANGHVFLINPNGVLFGPTAQVNVGGLLASTLSMTNEDFLAGRYRLAGASTKAVANEGSIAASKGGNVALVAAKVSNTGQIAADSGNVLLGAGSEVLVDFGGAVKLQVQKGALDALVENGGAIRADGGTVLLTAKSASELSGSVINNSGIVQARTLTTGEKGQILLLGDMQSGALNANGVLDASAPQGGDGGFIETSAAHVDTAAGLAVNAGAARGTGGQWLVDPYDYTINAAAAATIGGALNQGTSVTVTTQASNAAYGGGASGGGDITVASAINKTAGGDASLTLRADRNIIVNGDITSTSGKLNLTLSSANASGATVGGIDVNANLKSNGGNILIGGGNGNTSSGLGYALNINGSSAAVVVEQGKSILSSGGNITINGRSKVGSSSGSYGGTVGGVYIKSNATILSGTGNLLVNGESTGGSHTFGIAFEGNSNTITTMGSATGGGTMLLNAVNSTPGNFTQADLNEGAIGLVSYGNRDRIQFQGPSVANWLVYVNGAPQLSAYTQSPQLSNCATPYPNCGTMVVPGSNNSYLYATYRAVNMSTLPIYMIQTGAGTKVYDGDTTATGLSYTIIGAPNGFMASNLTPNPRFYTASKNAGNYNTLAPDAANPVNYSAAGTTYAVGYFSTGSYTITQKSLTPAAADKVYDGTNTAAVTLGGAVAGDAVTASGSGSFGGKDVGTYNVSIANIALGGADAANYTLSGNTASATASITPRTVTLDASKVYDGSANFAGLAAGNLVAGESLLLTGVTANSANVATARYISAATLADGQNGLASNYRLPSLSAASAANSAAITPKALNISGITVADKVYDGSVTAGLSGGVLNALVGGETLNLSALSGSFADKNVGAGKSVSLSAVSLSDGSGLASNYTFAQPSGLSGTITPKTLTVSGITAADKVYDGGTAASVNAAGAVFNGLAAGDEVSVSASGAFANANAGSGKTVNLASNFGGRDVGNYAITGQAAATASIQRKTLTVSGLGVASKTYDGTTNASLTGGTLVGLVSSETLNLGGMSANFLDKNAGAGKTVNIGGGVLSDGTGLASNYSLSLPASVLGAIGQKALSVSGILAADKVYDGGTAASVNAANAVLSGLVAGDSVTVSATGAFAGKDAGSNKTVTLNSSVGGADAGNYAVTGQSTTTASITPKALSITGMSVQGKVYDGTRAATLNGGVLNGLVGNETLGISGAAASFADKSAGSGKSVTVTGIALSDGTGLASNYSLAQPAGLTGNIAPKALTVSGITASDKVYDGGTAASVNAANAVFNGLVAGDSVSVNAVGVFTDKNAGANKTVALNGSYGGADVANYTITGQGSAMAAITPKALTLTGLAAASKTYDGTTAASLSGGALTGLVGNETLHLLGLNGAFADRNAGDNKTVNLSGGLLADGTGMASNYSLSVPASVTASIARKALTVSGITAADKVYDGSANASVSTANASFNGLVAGDDVTVSATGAFVDKNAGSNKTVALNGSLGGADAANYAITSQTSTTASIARKALTVTGLGVATKTYDGSTAASLTGGTLSGLVGGETLQLAGLSGSFADKNAGVDKAVSVTGGQLADGSGLASNYTLIQPAVLAGTITRKALTVSGATVADKTADGSTSASLSAAGSLVGAVAGDSVALNGSAASAQFVQAAPGAGIAVNVSGLVLQGADAGNYAFSGATATSGSILPAAAVTPPPTPTPVQTPVQTPAPAPVTPPTAPSIAAAIAPPQNQGIVSVLQAPAMGGMSYLAVQEQGAAPAEGAESGVSATGRRQSSTQAHGEGRDVKYLDVLVVSGGIRMPAAGEDSGAK